MKELEITYSNLLRQNVRCKGKITNLYNGITVELDTKDYVTKEEFVINFLNQFRESYGMFAEEYNQKDYKKVLAEKIKQKEEELEQLKFAHKICGRKIIDK